MIILYAIQQQNTNVKCKVVNKDYSLAKQCQVHSPILAVVS